MMEALNKHKAQRSAVDGMNFYGSKNSFSKHKNEVRHQQHESKTCPYNCNIDVLMLKHNLLLTPLVVYVNISFSAFVSHILVC